MSLYIILGIILLAILFTLKTKEKFTQGEMDITTHPTNTGKYPKFPLPLFSTIHKPENKKILSSINYCGDCSSLESKLVEKGINLINQGDAFTGENSISLAVPKCSGCSMLLETWNRYYTIVNNINNFIKSGTLPEPPKISSNCESCQDIQNKNREFSKRKLDETLQVIKRSSDGVKSKRSENPVGIPNIKYTKGLDPECPNCLKVYTEWSIYIVSLMEIQNYLYK